MDFTSLMVTSAVLVPIVMGVVQLIKNLGVNSAYAAVVAVFLGVGAEFLAVGTIVQSPSRGITILLGVVVGLSAAGLYSGAKAFGQGLNQPKY